MRTLHRCLCIPVVLVACLTTSCGDDDKRPDETTVTEITPPSANQTAATVDVPLTSDVATPVATDDIPLPTPLVTADIPPVPEATSDADAPTLVEVTVGVDSSPERIDPVALGDTVTLSVTNPTSDDEFHLHGYELGDGVHVPAGQAETFTFVANQTGDFPLESHETGDVLMTLSVE